MEDYPRQQINEADVGGEESNHLRAAKDLEREYIQVVRKNPQHAEQTAATQELAWKEVQETLVVSAVTHSFQTMAESLLTQCKSLFSEILHTIPQDGDKTGLVRACQQLTD